MAWWGRISFISGLQGSIAHARLGLQMPSSRRSELSPSTRPRTELADELSGFAGLCHFRTVVIDIVGPPWLCLASGTAFSAARTNERSPAMRPPRLVACSRANLRLNLGEDRVTDVPWRAMLHRNGTLSMLTTRPCRRPYLVAAGGGGGGRPITEPMRSKVAHESVDDLVKKLSANSTHVKIDIEGAEETGPYRWSGCPTAPPSGDLAGTPLSQTVIRSGGRGPAARAAIDLRMWLPPMGVDRQVW